MLQAANNLNYQPLPARAVRSLPKLAQHNRADFGKHSTNDLSLKDVHVGHGGMAPHKLRQAISLIDHHLSDEEEGRVALRVVASTVRMSYFHFSRAFKQSMGMTATTYIAERRIERAKKMLEETELPISEIALRSGFSSQSHFTTAFRRLAGATPKAFRAAL